MHTIVPFVVRNDSLNVLQNEKPLSVLGVDLPGVCKSGKITKLTITRALNLIFRDRNKKEKRKKRSR